MKKNNSISRRESLTLLATGLVSLHDLSNFNYNTIAKDKRSTEEMKRIARNNEQVMKTIGIIGGMGRQATIDLEVRIHKVAQQVLQQQQ